MSDVTKPGRFRRIGRAVLNAIVTLSFVAAAAVAALMGSDILADRAEAGAASSVADPIPVRVQPLILTDGFGYERAFTGQVEANASATLSFERGGRLADLAVREGDAVSKGQRLATLDTALLRAERDRLSASREATLARLPPAESRLARAQALRQDGFASEEALEQARADRDELLGRLREIDAAIASVDVSLDKSELFAPFDGHIGQRNVDGGETLAAGTPVLTLIETAAPRVRVGLPLSLDLTGLDEVEVTVASTAYRARLEQIRPDIDPVTRTRTAIYELETDSTLTVGQTATLFVRDDVDATGSWVPLDALQEGIGGAWTILTVEDDVVRTATVEIRHAEATRAYVRGTFPPGTRMIASGAHRVVPGQQVRVIATED